LAITMSASSAVPVVFNSIWERDVWAPKVTNPNATTVWKSGSNQTVTWYVERALHPKWGWGSISRSFSFACVIGTRQTALRMSRTPQGLFSLGLSTPMVREARTSTSVS
jgi:hypothetical protein